MKSRLLLIPLIIATTAATADTQPLSDPADAQAQAAALLRPAHTSGTLKVDGQRRSPSTVSAAMDAQARAAALLRPRAARTGNARDPIGQPSRARISGDAQAQAAALLRGSQRSTDSRLREQQTKSGVAGER